MSSATSSSSQYSPLASNLVRRAGDASLLGDTHFSKLSDRLGVEDPVLSPAASVAEDDDIPPFLNLIPNFLSNSLHDSSSSCAHKNPGTSSSGSALNADHDPFVILDIEDKTKILHGLVKTRKDPIASLRSLTALHYKVERRTDGKLLGVAQLRAQFLQHKCCSACLVRESDAVWAGYHGLSALTPRDIERARLSLAGKSYTPRVPTSAGSNSFISSNFPVILKESDLRQLEQDFIQHTSAAAMEKYKCSFCGYFGPSSQRWHSYSTKELDISLLETATLALQTVLDQPNRSTYNPQSIVDGQFQVCSHCHVCVRVRPSPKFIRIPPQSYANGLWFGELPTELQGLSFLEEQCIARARSTRCLFKIQTGPTGQYAVRGNACIFPQNPSSLIMALPPPLKNLRDEVCVLLVGSPNKQVTEDILKRSPLLVRRDIIYRALKWLIANNPLYRDVTLDAVNLAEYPLNGCPIAVQQTLGTEGTSSEGSSYTSYSEQANAEYFSQQDSSFLSFSSTVVVDPDIVSKTYQKRKLEALRQLKSGSPFVKYPSGSTPLSTSKNPALWGHLWPTLFPWGIGMMDFGVLTEEHNDVGFRHLDFATHIKHLMRLKDNRFQTHISFMFIVSNLMQRKKSSFNARLATRRSWFPNVQTLMSQIDDKTIESWSAKLERNPLARPETDGEQAAVQLMAYLQYVSEHVPGSVGDVNLMRQEMKSLMIVEGLPHFFATINPADTYNPIAQVLAGRNIDLDKFFHQLEVNEKKEGAVRTQSIVSNPVAGAEFFNTIIESFIDIFLGVKRKDSLGLFGKVKCWYGVVEAQARGSLHLHVLIWVDGAPASPLEMKQLVEADAHFGERLLRWYDSLVVKGLPEGTHGTCDEELGKKPVMCRPMKFNAAETEHQQDLRNVLETTGQIHSHNATCFKHLPSTIRALRDDDKEYRFQLPAALVEKTHFDLDGDPVLKCTNGSVNGYNPTLVRCFRCNMDLKGIFSGTTALAMVEYNANYVAKLQLDMSVVFSALCGAIKALKESPPKDPEGRIDPAEQSRLLLVKASNSLVGKRELSQQQVASLLLGRSNKYVSHDFAYVYWSALLRELDASEFSTYKSREKDSNDDEVDGDDGIDDEDDVLSPEHSDSLIVLTQQNLDGPCTSEVQHNTLFNDIFFRPPELEEFCAWDLITNYERVRLPTSQKQRKVFLRFKPGHPQYLSHCLKGRDKPAIPTLIGQRIPRADSEADATKYAIVITALFKPWSDFEQSPLKPLSTTWINCFEELKPLLNENHIRTIANMQLLYQTKDAKFDYSLKRRQRLNELATQASSFGIDFNAEGHLLDEDDTCLAYAMQDASLEDDDLSLAEVVFPAGQIVFQSASAAGFYATEHVVPHNISTRFKDLVKLSTDESRRLAEEAMKNLQKEKERYLLARDKQMEAAKTSAHLASSNEGIHKAFTTTLAFEQERAQQLLQRTHLATLSQDPSMSIWEQLRPYQQLSICLVLKHTLNQKQTLAFLLLADQVGRQLEQPNIKLDPLRLLLTGPGGTGKSLIFQAWTEFHEILGVGPTFKLTAPTGVVASDIGGATIHSDASLMVDQKKMLSNDRTGAQLREKLEKRFQNTLSLILDECYFLGPKVFHILAKYLSLAKGGIDDKQLLGWINFIVSGDPAQLPPPRQKTLFDAELVKCFLNDNLNGHNEQTKNLLQGMLAWRQIDRAVVLEENMRQRNDPILKDILTRLRWGMCTEADKEVLDRYVLSNTSCSDATRSLTNVQRWINHDSEWTNCCPMIVSINDVRDRHNDEMARTFAQATGQESHVYYSEDYMKKGNEKIFLKSKAALAAWNVRVKDAKDLGGRVRYVPGMPIFIAGGNIATELGISNGSIGVLVSLEYKLDEKGRRYATSAVVDMPKYVNPDASESHPHRVTLTPVSTSIQFRLDGSEQLYSATRRQLPIIPAFAFTAHNSQGRSLHVCCIDLAGCTTTEAAYVMLSRVRSLEGLCILRPFSFSKISTRISEQLRTELKRGIELGENTFAEAKHTLHWFYDIFPDGDIANVASQMMGGDSMVVD